MVDVERIKTDGLRELKVEFMNSYSEDENCEVKFINKVEAITPAGTPKKLNQGKGRRKAATTTRKKLIQDSEVEAAASVTRKTVTAAHIQTTTKKNFRSKEPPPSQLRIDSYFKSCSKSYKIEPRTEKDKNIYSTAKMNTKSVNNRRRGTSRTTRNKGRKRLFKEEDEYTTTASTVSGFTDMTPTPPRNARKRSRPANAARGTSKKPKQKSKDILDILIDLISDDDTEREDLKPNLVELDEHFHSIENKNTGEKIPQRIENVKKENINDLYNTLPEENAMESTVMVSIPVRRHTLEKCSETSNNKKSIKSELIKETHVNVLPKKATMAKSAQSAKPRSEVNVARNKKISQIEDRNNTNERREIACVTRSMTKATVPKTPMKVKENTKLLASTPPTPPQTSNDASSSNWASNFDICPVVNTKIVEVNNASPIPTQDKPLPSTSKSGRVKKIRVCPPYKVVAGTTFAVDAFQYGQIADVTHYFLTHFHADHYQGLTRKFSMPLFVSPLTARLVRALIPVEDQYLHEIDLNMPLVINGVEVTAIDANHCPGAVMFVFKLSTGSCILHTGDFRASPDMESEPIFWNNYIDRIYLDTTYIAHKHNFCSQHESIDRAKCIIEKFHNERPTTRILYVCGSYVIGKERFWTRLAHEFGLKVWTEKNRLTALRAMDLDEVRGLLCDDPYLAQMHVISIGKVSYQSLVEYFRQFHTHFDAVLAFRPSGWEKNNKPSLRGQINIVGIEYSEHSSNAELERFVTYLKPREVISTVPVTQGKPCITPKIPDKWYKYDTLKSRQRKFQPSITSFLTMLPRQPTKGTYTKRTTNCVTPTKSPGCMRNELSQLSVRAMTTCVQPEVETDDDVVCMDIQQATSNKTPMVKRDYDAMCTDMQATTSSKVQEAIITLFPDGDALDDWIY
ncbi:PREDICTED: DNA cross-link repair 1A protein [Rhagoletis zephyria]|uniref:DNA cross-link repair 1A protein n=1 Tax=Rhagoletis zephyria TaxID=28612 RepID=UPI0008114F13|nr:PREDICTED: DNA cross-link repair 1A protein [Rhagoletis zephyria]